MCEAKRNAFLAICKAYNKEMRTANSGDLEALKLITRKHGAMSELLGFSTTAMKVQVGRMNGVLKER